MKATTVEMNGAARHADGQEGVGGQLVVVKGRATQPGVGAEAGGQADFDAIAVWMALWPASFS